ncbi:DUF998 domain-containing protein [Candidatus Nomurabacteria bacterium]|nr:DUF998 domain-containing protein [Candidatus Nomurabacteria bacterium]MCB9827737.1 DUF998 domain-containing protein [Candidatus Nomurabacteria bacterium]
MPSFLKYIGLVNIFLFLTIASTLLKISDKVDLKSKTASNLATDKKTATIFNLSLFVFALGQIIFSLIANYFITGKVFSVPSGLFLIGGVCLILSSFITMKSHKEMHSNFSNFSSLFVGLGLLLLSLSLLSTNLYLGILLILGSLLIPISYLVKGKLRGAYWEVVLFTGFLICNVVLSIPLLFPSVLK